VYHSDANTVICSGYDEQASKALVLNKDVPRDWNFQQLPEEWDMFCEFL